MSAHESGVMKKMRKENLAGLTGRVLEVGAGTGTNFAFYPDTVTEVVALEPETRLAPHASAGGGDGTRPGDGHRVHHRDHAGRRAVRRRGVLAGAVLGRGPG